MTSMDPSKRDILLTLGPGRSDLYVMLATAYALPPSAELLQTLCSEAFLGPMGEVFGDTIVTKLGDLTGLGPSAELQEQLRQEFMGLFKVPGDRYVAAYESVYRDSRDVGGEKVNGLLMGQSALDVQKWYQLAAVEIADDYKDLPDHIALELNYLALLCVKEQDFAKAGNDTKLTRVWEMERDFLAGHVVCWVDQLRDRIRAKSEHPYFQAIADMTVEFTHRDLATLEDVLGPSSGSSVPQYKDLWDTSGG
jgi:TorA maturation chaperone TorD